MQSLNDAAVLKQIGPARVAKFLHEFTPDLAEINIPIPTPESDNGSYFDSVAALLSNPSLPRHLREALTTLETAAAPENQGRIDDAIARRLPCVATSCALDRVLELWFQARDELSQFTPAPHVASEKTPSPPPEERDGERRSSGACPSTFDPAPAFSGSTIQPFNDSTGSTSNIQHPVSSIQEPSSIQNPPSPNPIIHQSINPLIHPSTLDPRPSSSDLTIQQFNDSTAFQHLARLSAPDYDRARKSEAKRLGIRVETLDAEVARHRQLSDDEKARAVILPPVVPWPEPVNGAEVLDQVSSRFTLHVVMPPGAADAIALWDAQAHIFTAFPLSPRLNLTSPESECGKTTTLDLLAAMTPRPLRTENLTAPVLFRVVDQRQPVLLLDEVDTFLPYDEELRGLLNAGHKRGGCAYRCEGANNAVRAFKAFSPAVLSGIGPLPATLHDRSIRIYLVKAQEGQVTAHFNELKAEIETELCRKLARWTQDNYAAIAACEPAMPKAAFNRLGDNWRSLFAIAQIAGGHWPARALAAFTHLAARPSPVSSAVVSSAVVNGPVVSGPVVPHQPSTNDSQLLLAIRSIFASRNATCIASKDLVAALQSLPHTDAPTLPRSNVLSARLLAQRLAPYGIRSRVLTLAGRQSRGYDLSDFENAISKVAAAKPEDNPSASPPPEPQSGADEPSFSI